jgi:hypothetical protein
MQAVRNGPLHSPFSNGDVLAIETQSAASGFGTAASSQWVSLIQPAAGTASRLWTVGPQGRSPFATSHFAFRCRLAV